MKKLIAIFLLLFILAASCTNSSNESTSSVDTVQTASGLRYVFLERGDGRAVERGSSVKTKLSLKVGDDVVWTSYQAPDSIFEFIAGSGTVIKGFDEMALLMREGDNVMAILPDSLAYGSSGSGENIPPNSTLIYDRYEVVEVSEPKMFGPSEVYDALMADGFEAMKTKYEQVVDDTVAYHPWDNYSLIRRLEREEKYEDMKRVALFLSEQSDDPSAHYGVVKSMENLGDFEGAVKKFQSMIEANKDSENFNAENWNKELDRLKGLLNDSE